MHFVVLSGFCRWEKAGEEDEEESDKSKSEVNDEEDEEGSGEVSVSEKPPISSSFCL